MLSSEGIQRTLRRKLQANDKAPIFCTTLNMSWLQLLPFPMLKARAKLSTRTNTFLFRNFAALLSLLANNVRALPSFKVMCSWVCFHFPVLATLQSSGLRISWSISLKLSFLTKTSVCSIAPGDALAVSMSNRGSRLKARSRGLLNPARHFRFTGGYWGSQPDPKIQVWADLVVKPGKTRKQATTIQTRTELASGSYLAIILQCMCTCEHEN